MAAYQTVFRRIEKKYLLNRQQYESLRHQIDSMTVPDKFEKSTICNIYFDTPNYQLILWKSRYLKKNCGYEAMAFPPKTAMFLWN